MKTFLFWICIFCFGWCLWSCERVQSGPEVPPEIHFEKLIFDDIINGEFGIVKIAILTFSFVDDNGDLGVRNEGTNDTLSCVYVVWQKKLEDGTYENYEFDTGIVQTFRIPYNEQMNKDEAQNKRLKGKMDITLFPPSGPPPGMDSVRLEYYIMDRALLKSNIDHTPVFSILNTVGLEIKKE